MIECTYRSDEVSDAFDDEGTVALGDDVDVHQNSLHLVLDVRSNHRLELENKVVNFIMYHILGKREVL